MTHNEARTRAIRYIERASTPRDRCNRVSRAGAILRDYKFRRMARVLRQKID